MSKCLYFDILHLLFNIQYLYMAYIMVDIESDGPIPGDYSMICFGAVF
jgi:hypothetical protein